MSCYIVQLSLRGFSKFGATTATAVSRYTNYYMYNLFVNHYLIPSYRIMFDGIYHPHTHISHEITELNLLDKNPKLAKI